MIKSLLNIVLIIVSTSVYSQIRQAKTYYDAQNSKIKEIYYYNKKDAQLNGLYESFYSNGSLKISGWYVNNTPDSLWKFYFENGRLKTEGQYKNGYQTGLWKYFYENGNVKSQGILHEGIKNGFWTFFYETGGEKSNGMYVEDVKNGIWNYFYENETLKGQSYLENGTGKYTEFYPSGSPMMEGTIKNEISVGEWQYFYETGELEARGKFTDGMRTNQWNYFHKNGMLSATGIYKNGERHGKWKFYHNNGTLSESGILANGIKDGYWKLFYPSGELQGEITFKSGSGNFDEYHPSGSKKSNGDIVNGKKNGKWYYYSDKGLIEGEANLINGEGIYTGFYPSGKIKMSGKLKDDKRVGQWTLYNEDGSLAGTYIPIYENERPIFRTRESKDLNTKNKSSKPEYKFKKKDIRYFEPRINEYKTLIVGVNPVGLIYHRLPVALEYYIQERMGFEIQFDALRQPFFTNENNIPIDEEYERGFQIHLKQKFYNRDSPLGMLYFGHQVAFKRLEHKVKSSQATFSQSENLKITETGYSYGVLVGSRWMRNVGNKGPTIDIYFGLAISRTDYQKSFEPDPLLSDYFKDTIQESLQFPILFGIDIGWALNKNKSQTQ